MSCEYSLKRQSDGLISLFITEYKVVMENGSPKIESDERHLARDLVADGSGKAVWSAYGSHGHFTLVHCGTELVFVTPVRDDGYVTFSKNDLKGLLQEMKEHSTNKKPA